ncbi:carboxypeptidase-like regulatory domain-containing protein [Arthrospiribacter ruber]|nr:carboxypeptidase-like regulatory domain-containing protein [Arthrospiribacter ruber]
MLTGQILSGKTQEGIPFSHIYISEFPEFIAISNEDGRFVLRIPQGAEQISISHINYRKLTLSLEEFKKQAVIYLEENEQSLGEVTVEFFTPKSLMEKVIENKWYLNFTKYPRSNFSTGSISERLTMYFISQEIPSDLQFFPASSLVRPFVSDFASDFNDEFWEDENFIPLPQWIIENLK